MEPLENHQVVGDKNQSTASKQLYHSSWRGTLKTTTFIIRGDKMEIINLKKENYEELISVLNEVFSEHNNKKMDFEKELPKMCKKDDEHTGKHYGIKDDGKIVAVIGIYPIKVNIMGKELMFSTVGNVATLKKYEGKGYMKALMTFAMDKIEKMGVDASRLGGARQRYNRYGYEMCASLYKFDVNDYTTKSCYTNRKNIRFEKIEKDDIDKLEFIKSIRKNNGIYVYRSDDNDILGEYEVLVAWQNTPYICIDENGNYTGFISANEKGDVISDVCAKDIDSFIDIIYNWQIKVGEKIWFTVGEYDTEIIKYFSSVCSNMSIYPPCHFKIINFDKVADALIKLKASYTKLSDTEFVLGIKDYGNLLICVKDGKAFCEKCDKKPHITLDKLSATRFLFGPFSPNTVCDVNLSHILPLPLTWNTLDRL